MSRRCLATLPDGFAEMLRLLPTLEALAGGGREVVALAAPEVLGLLRLAPVDLELLPRLDQPAATRAVVHAAACDEAAILSGRLADAWLARTAGIGGRWGHATLAGGWFLNRRVRRPRKAKARRVHEDFRELLDAMGATLTAAPRPRLAFGDELRAAARERLTRARVDKGGPLVGVYPGVQGGAGARPWPRERFDEVVRELRRHEPSTRCVLLATTDDLWQAVRVFEETGKIHPVIGPELTPDVLAAVLGELDLVIAAESWMLDLAAAAGASTVGLYVRDPRRWAPPGEEHRALTAGKGALAEITVDEVIQTTLAGRPNADGRRTL